MDPLPWRRLVTWALLGTTATALAVLINVDRTGRNPVNLLQAGRAGPSAAVIQHDFPDTELPGGIGHDGQQFYAIARAPMHPRAVALQLDRPHYRLQRILYPALAWVLHPQGGGTGLIAAMFVVGLLALVGGGVATGALSLALGGRAWVAVLFPLLPGSYVSLRISTADALSLAMAVTAVALLAHDRFRPALVAAALSVLAKETSLLLLVGWALWRRDRRAIAVVATSVGLIAVWAGVLRLLVDVHSPQVQEFTLWFGGLRDTIEGRGTEHWGPLMILATALLAAAALTVRGVRHPLAPGLLVQLALLPNLSLSALGLDLNATRVVMPAMLLALVMLATPGPPGQPEPLVASST